MRKKEQLDSPRHPILGPEHAIVEASRCINCFDAPCIDACPTSINIPQFISRIGSGDLLGSAQSILASNILGHSCATVCPVEVLCEGSCVYNKLEEPPIRIGDLQKYATEHFYTENLDENIASLKKDTPRQEVNVCAIGGGPASLAFAAYIVLNGGRATVYEAAEKAGGLNTYGVAPYKLSKKNSLDEVEMIEKLGVRILYNQKVGEGADPATLLKEHDAVFIGVGLAADKTAIDVPPNTTGITGALPLIAKLKNSGPDAVRDIKNALVIGGGNTALDVVQELALCGVPNVSLAYRKGEKEMSGYGHELRYALSFGVQFLQHHSPLNLETENGRVTGAVFRAGNHAAANADVATSEVTVPADLVVFATGQKRHPFVEWFPKLVLEDNGCVRADKFQKTNLDKIYAGGDCANGGKEVVNAVAEGREAAYNVLIGKKLKIYYGRFKNQLQRH